MITVLLVCLWNTAIVGGLVYFNAVTPSNHGMLPVALDVVLTTDSDITGMV